MKNSYGWDRIIVSCADNRQKNICERLLNNISSDLSPYVTFVSDDVCHNRIGSGGSLLNVICSFCKKGEKVLLINSGGSSKRCINYALKGKAFAETYFNGCVNSLLEIIIKEYSKAFSSAVSGIVVCCSDIVVKFDDILKDFSDNMGFCCRTDFETASRHGVMISEDDGYLYSFLHKKTLKELKSKVTDNFALTDTGLVYFTDEFVQALRIAEIKYNIVDSLRSNNCELNLYQDIIPFLCRDSSYLLSGTENNILIELKNHLSAELSNYRMKVCDLKNSPFVHFGTVSESIKNILEFSGCSEKEHVEINSIVESNSVCSGTVIENSFIDSSSSIGRNCFVSDISLYGVSIPDNTAVCGFYTDDSYYITVVCDINENPKDIINGLELFNTKRFYKGLSFTDSFNKYLSGADGEKFSMNEAIVFSSSDYPVSYAEYLRERKKCNVSDKYLNSSNKILSDWFLNSDNHGKFNIAEDHVNVKLPVRVNLSGTWTDAMPYCIDNGGAVVNMAVTVAGSKPIEIKINKLASDKIIFVNDGKRRVFSFTQLFRNDVADEFDEFRLHKIVLKILGFNSDAVPESGFEFSINVSGIMSGSGLGTSSILLGGCFKAFSRFFDLGLSEDDIFYNTFAAEQLMKTGGGWQDQVGGLLPGIKYTVSEPGLRQKLSVSHIICNDNFLKGRIALVSTRQRHFGRFVVNDVMNRYIDSNFDTLEAFRLLSNLNKDTIESIENNDIASLCSCVNKQWNYLKMLSPMVTNDKIDLMVDKCRRVADAVCICGAGAGGYLFLILKENSDFDSFDEPIIPIELYN